MLIENSVFARKVIFHILPRNDHPLVVVVARQGFRVREILTGTVVVHRRASVGGLLWERETVARVGHLEPIGQDPV